MNTAQILASAATAVEILSAAGVPVPPAILTTITRAVPIISAVSSVSLVAPTNISQAIDDLAAIAKTIQTTGIASADTQIATILAEVDKYAASKNNFESGQIAILANYAVSIKGESKKAYLATFIEGGPAAQALGL